MSEEKRDAPREPSALTGEPGAELARLLADMHARIRVARAWFIGLGDDSPDAMIAASFIRIVELLLAECADLRESRDGALRQRDAAETDRDLAQEAARRLCEGQAKGHVAALLEYERQLARADRLWIGGEKREKELRASVAELEADVRRLQAQIEASAELHREDQKRADDLANVPG